MKRVLLTVLIPLFLICCDEGNSNNEKANLIYIYDSIKPYINEPLLNKSIVLFTSYGCKACSKHVLDWFETKEKRGIDESFIFITDHPEYFKRLNNLHINCHFVHDIHLHNLAIELINVAILSVENSEPTSLKTIQTDDLKNLDKIFLLSHN